ncbi:MAG: MFS family permease [Porticoccaceae bacterium]
MKQPRFFYGYTVVAYSFVVLFLASSFFLHTRGVFFPVWMEEFDVGRTEISLAITLTLFTGSCIAPFMGYMIDKFPIRWISTIGSLWLALGYFTYRWIDSYTAFLISLLLFQGVGWTTVGPLVQTKLMVNWFSRNRGMALGGAIMGISVAGIFMPTAAAYLLETFGWQQTYSIYAASIVLIIVPLTLFFVRQHPSDMGRYPDGDPEPVFIEPDVKQVPAVTGLAVYKEFLTTKAFWSVVLTFSLMNGVYSAMVTHLPNYLTTEFDFTLYEASYMLGLSGVAAIAGKVIFGWMVDHWDARITVLFGIASYLAGALIFVFEGSYSLIMFAAVLFGLAFGGMVPVRSVLISRIFGTEKFSRANGLFSLFVAPATFWVLITGYLADLTGTYATAFQVWVVTFFLAGIVTLAIRLPNREDAVA